MPDDDRDLYDAFAAVRLEEEAHVPPSSMLLTARRQGRRVLSGKLIAATLCLASLIAVAVWLLPGVHVAHKVSIREREQAEASIISWKPATDFLLDTPGRELLEDVPSLGEWHGEIMPGPGESHRPFRKRVVR
jgi:hypothetical protein